MTAAHSRTASADAGTGHDTASETGADPRADAGRAGDDGGAASTPATFTPATFTPAGPVLIVLGKDENGKAHASWFAADEAELAIKAAGLMGMAVLKIETEALFQQASKELAKGKIFASGRGFVPFVKASVFDDLVKNLPGGKMPKLKAVPKPDKPEKQAKAKGGSNKPSKATPALHPRPTDWGSIVKGSLVLAAEPDEPWCEAVVVDTRADGILVLRWRGYDGWPNVVRRREDVALLHPGQE